MTIRSVLKRRTMTITTAVAMVCAVAYLLFGGTAATNETYTYAVVSRGDIETTISSSGTLGPVTQVEVGTQVSGTVDTVLVDFNDKVRRGEIIAVIDTSVLVLAVADAQSGYIRAEAQMEESQTNYRRSVELFEKGMLSESEFQSVKTTYKTAQASVTSARSALRRAEQNLSYAIIRAPISGTVVARSIEAGQTVAASFATPTLFTIAHDLSKMEIKALIDESDIGQIKEGQKVRFTVQAYPKREFSGIVKQVRVQPTTTSNVVNYTVIISAENKENILLPGMTATVDVVVEKKSDVLLVPNGAFRFQPSESEKEAIRQQMAKMMEAQRDSMKSFGPPPAGGRPADGTIKQLWYIDAENRLQMEPVVAGISDGTNTEIAASRTITGKTKIISGTASPAKSAAASNSRSQQGPPGPPPF